MSTKTQNAIELEHCLSVVAEYILDSDEQEPWHIIERLEKELEIEKNKLSKLERYKNLKKS